VHNTNFTSALDRAILSLSNISFRPFLHPMRYIKFNFFRPMNVMYVVSLFHFFQSFSSSPFKIVTIRLEISTPNQCSSFVLSASLQLPRKNNGAFWRRAYGHDLPSPSDKDALDLGLGAWLHRVRSPGSSCACSNYSLRLEI
jgi:hypothetical protein